ncbi:MAG: ACP phosphodiesterase [Brumimicrobium sp.]|nr:ACP phosphodiesterase [Brumimicrobium sp.]
MNYLGHLYFSGDNHGLMLANLYGDFFKGSDFSSLPSVVKEGVILHRQIDEFTDQHPAILELFHRILYPLLPKVSGIAMDLFIDHLLASRWGDFHSEDLENYSSGFYRYALNAENHSFESDNLSFTYPGDFLQLLHIMQSKNWLLRYRFPEGLIMASKGLSARLSFENNLNEAPEVFSSYQAIIEKVFNEVMTDGKKKFLDLRLIY